MKSVRISEISADLPGSAKSVRNSEISEIKRGHCDRANPSRLHVVGGGLLDNDLTTLDNTTACIGEHPVLGCQIQLKKNSASKMKRAQFCLVPAGDTPSSSRLYDAIACGQVN